MIFDCCVGFSRRAGFIWAILGAGSLAARGGREAVSEVKSAFKRSSGCCPRGRSGLSGGKTGPRIAAELTGQAAGRTLGRQGGRGRLHLPLPILLPLGHQGACRGHGSLRVRGSALAFPLDLGARPLCRRLRGRGCANCTEHLPEALCSGTGSPALGLCSP